MLSRPTWARGLKQPGMRNDKTNRQSRPTWARGLKLLQEGLPLQD